MARFMRLDVLNNMIKVGLVPVFYNRDTETARSIAAACADGGAVCIELVNRGDGAVDIFKDLERFCMKKYPEVILGVGSIVDSATAAQFINMGANFIVGPVLDDETAVLCNKRKIPYIPGCGSATEIHTAHSLGAEICKIFPGKSVGGPEFVKAIKGPCPWTSIMPTGGVNPDKESLGAWFRAGVVCAGMGSKLISKDLVEKGDFGAIKTRVSDTIKMIKEIREDM